MDRMNNNTAKRGMCGAVVLALLMVLSIGTAYAQSEITVAGTQVYPGDVNNVQDAVDHFDIVNLLGTFNFGDDFTGRGTVTITRDGATLTGAGQATISGGMWSLTVEADNVTVEKLNFDGFRGAGVFISESGGTTTVRNNLFINGLAEIDPGAIWPWLTSGVYAKEVAGLVEGNLIVENNGFDLFRAYNADPNHDPDDWNSHPTGHVVAGVLVGMVWEGAPRVSIRNNEILEMPFALDPGLDYAPGIMVFSSPNAVFSIEGNTITDTHIGVWVGGRSEISNNTITTYGNCLLCWGEGGYSNIHHNTLTKTRVPPESGTWIWEDDAIFLMDGSHYSVRGNTIVVEDPYANSAIRFGSYFFELSANNNLIKGNKITGTGMLGNQLDWNSSDNVFLGNNLSGLDCSATYYLGPSTYDNIVKGYTAECEVIDETDNPDTPEYDGLNLITGCER